MSDLWRLSATELAARIRGREVSAREAAQAALARLDAVNPALNAVVDHRPEEVLAAADAVDARLAQGEDPGVLAGVPVTVKVNVDQAGHATTNGLRLQKDLIAKEDSPVVSNLRRAGAVILGRTNTPAFSLRWFTSNGVHGRTRNPRNTALTPGGSSGGAASAVAAGIGHLAHGTDIAGSIRYPAYACGVHGLRPTQGRVAAWNPSGPDRVIGAQLMAVSGPIARTIADLRLGLQALAAPDPRDPWWVPAPLEGPPLPRRAALCLRPGGLAIAPEVEAALNGAAYRLAEAGWEVEVVDDLPPLHEAAEMTLTLWLGAGFADMAAQAALEGDAAAIATLEHHRATAEALAPDAVPRALQRRLGLQRQWLLFVQRYPLVVMPASAELPFPDDLDQQGPEAMARVVTAQLPQVALPSLALPGLVVSTGMAGDSPVGVQLVAGRYREDVLLSAGAALEAAGAPPMPAEVR